MASNGNDITTKEIYCDNCGAANPTTARFCQFCSTLLPFKYTTGSLPEETLLAGRYQLLSRIGQGGMGAVYRAQKRHLSAKRIYSQICSILICPASMSTLRKMTAGTWSWTLLRGRH